MRRLCWIGGVVAAAAFAIGCGDDSGGGSPDAASNNPDAPPGTPDAAPADAPPGTPDAAPVTSTTKDLGAAGGTIAVDGCSLVIPAGALSATASYTLQVTNETTFPPLTQKSPIYSLTPPITGLASPATITITGAAAVKSVVPGACTPASRGVFEGVGGDLSFTLLPNSDCAADGSVSAPANTIRKILVGDQAAPLR